MNKMDEQILVIDRAYLFQDEHRTFQGVLKDEISIGGLMSRLSNFFVARRGDAEENPDWKQPITYTIVKQGDSVFCYKRLKGGGESRLHEQLSIGVGGHMNIVGNMTRWKDILMDNMYRELQEELDIVTDVEPEVKVLGLINDDHDEVGLVHLGILAILELPEDAEVTVRETDELEGYWIRIRDLNKTPLFESLESWSKIAANIL